MENTILYDIKAEDGGFWSEVPEVLAVILRGKP